MSAAATVPGAGELLDWIGAFLRQGGHAAAPLRADDTFHGLGVDSVLASEMVFALGDKLGIEIDPTLVYDSRTVGAFGDSIRALLRQPGACS